MTLSHKLFQKLVILSILLVGTWLLGACVPGNALSGGSGLSNPNDDPTELPLDPPPPAEDTTVAVPPTSGHIVFVSNRDDGKMSLYKTTPDGFEQIRLTTTPETDDVGPVLSPDGTKVAFVSTVDDNTDIYILDLNSLAVTRVTNALEKDSAPTWSPDGQRLAFESFRDGNYEIYVTNIDGSNQVRLTNDPSGDTNPVWSPKNDEIAFSSTRFGNSDILLLTPNGITNTLTTSIDRDASPAWSPDGNMLAYKLVDGSELANLCIINRDGTGQKCLTKGPSEYGSPVWSPNGGQFAVTAKQSGGYGISIFNIDNPDNVIQLFSQDVEPKGDPFWSPEGARLVFQGKTGGDMELFIATVPTNEFVRLTTTIDYEGEPAWTSQ